MKDTYRLLIGERQANRDVDETKSYAPGVATLSK